MREFFVFAFCMFTINSFCQESFLTIVRSGESKYVVTLNKNASQEEERAASILRYYVKKTTGVNLPLSTSSEFAFRIEITKDPALPVGGFYIYSKSNIIYIIGGKENGTTNGVLFILKTYFETDFISVNNVYVPALQTVTIKTPLLVRQQPSFITRTIHSIEGYDYDYVETHSLQIPFLHHNGFAHTFNTDLLPPDLYFKSHPEYYILYNGKRDSMQPNLLNPDVFKIVLGRIKKKIQADIQGKYQYYSISLNDNPVVSEDAETSRSLDKNGRNYMSILLNFVNKIADSFPDKNFTTLAYEQTKTPPSNVTPHKNVIIILTNADNNKSKPIYIDDYDNQQHVYMKKEIPLWVNKNPSLIFWDYIANYTNPIMPWPNLYTIKPNLKFYQQSGIKHLFIQNAGLFPSENSELKAYLCSNLMWNVDDDDDSLIKVFCQKFYQHSWEAVYEYIKDINRQAFNGKAVFYTYDNAVKFKDNIFSNENVVKWQSLLRRAEVIAENDTIKKRVLRERLRLDYLYMDLSANAIGWNKTESNANLLKRLTQFQVDVHELGILKLFDAVPSYDSFIHKVQLKLK